MIKDLIKYALLAIALLVVTMLVTYAFAHVFHLDKTNRNAVDDWLYLLLLIPVFHKLRYIDLQDAISVNRFSWGVFLVAFICLSTMSYAIDMGASLLHISKDSQSQMEMEVVRHPFALFTVSVIAPISEEIFFRGALLRRMLQSSKWSSWMAITCSALVFSALHYYSVMIINALFVGILFGWLYYKTRSLLLTISLHLVNNSLYSITLLTPLKDVQYAQMNTWVIVLSIVILIALSVVSFKWLHAKFLYSPTL